MAQPAVPAENACVGLPPFAIEITEAKGAIRMIVSGELALETAPQLRQTLSEQPRGATIVVDLSGVTFMDSTGIAALVRGYAAHREAGGRMALGARLGPVAGQVLKVAGLLEHMAVEPA